jgi:hypothetical protein
VNKENAELLQWHARERKNDALLRHPSNGSQWRNFDRKHKDFFAEVRNIRFGLSTNGINPYVAHIAHGLSLYVSRTYHAGFV